MAEVITMPRMSDTMTEGKLVSWLKKEGDAVKSGDVLAEVETDKATMELESYVDGTLLHIGIQEGSSVPVNSVIAVIGKPGEDFKSLLNGGSGTPEKKTEDASAPARAIENSDSETKPELKTESPKEDAPKVETPKEDAPKVESAPKTEAVEANADHRMKASPLAKKMAEDKGVDISHLTGSGDAGRIVRKDVEAALQQSVTDSQTQTKPETAQPQKAAQSVPAQGAYEDITLSSMRKTIARRLGESMFTAPHFYLTVEVNMDKNMEFRKQIMELSGEKVSFNDIIIKAAAAALRKHPKVNASWMEDKIRQYSYINIGVAMAVEDGLLVPVIRNADSKGITEISKEVKNFAELAKNKKLQPADWEGNTFSISNLGMFGIEEFTAIINPPDACILAVGAIREVPVVEKGLIKIGNVMKLTLSCDHRVVDGAIGAQFLQTLKKYLEQPMNMLA